MAFEIKQGSLKPAFVVALKDNYGTDDEEVTDLTGYTSATFSMRKKTDKTIKVDAATAEITNEGGGEVTYAWVLGDTDTVGDFEAEVTVIGVDTKPEKYPSTGFWEIKINESIATTP
jgi:hypothetical protein